MSLRKIHISNSKSRNTLIDFKGFTPKKPQQELMQKLVQFLIKKLLKVQPVILLIV